MNLELARLDDRLCIEAKRMLPKPAAVLPVLQPQTGDNIKVRSVNNSPPTLSAPLLINDLVSKLRTHSADQLLLFVKSNEHGVVATSAGIDIESILTTLNWRNVSSSQTKASQQTSHDCQLASFEHLQKQWHASYYDVADTESFIAVAIDAPLSELQHTLRSTFIFVIPISLLLAVVGGGFIASNTIRPINRLHKSMDKVTQKDLRHRLSVHKEDKEFKVLIDAYNTMLERLEDSFQQASRFTADAAHELKTPLTVLRGKLDQAITSDNTAQLDLTVILDEVNHLSAITRKLLLLSQADACAMALHLQPVNISELLQELSDDMGLLFEDLSLECKIQPSLIIKADLVLLTQLLNNLLVNVMRYSIHEQGGTIQATQDKQGILLLISNTCYPISTDTREHLFERFYRGELAQSQARTGSGLGLSLSREIARAHGGELTLEPSTLDVVTMKLFLPLS